MGLSRMRHSQLQLMGKSAAHENLVDLALSISSCGSSYDIHVLCRVNGNCKLSLGSVSYYSKLLNLAV